MATNSKLESITQKVIDAFQRGLENGTITNEEAGGLNYLLEVLDSRGGRHHQDTAPAPMGDPVTYVEAPRVNLNVDLTDQIAVATRPNINMARLSFGLINLDQVAMLDVHARQLYLAGGVVRSLDLADTRAMAYHLNLYKAP